MVLSKEPTIYFITSRNLYILTDILYVTLHYQLHTDVAAQREPQENFAEVKIISAKLHSATDTLLKDSSLSGW